MIIAILLFAALALAVGVLSYRYPWWRANLPETEPRILCYHMIALTGRKAIARQDWPSHQLRLSARSDTCLGAVGASSR